MKPIRCGLVFVVLTAVFLGRCASPGTYRVEGRIDPVRKALRLRLGNMAYHVSDTMAVDAESKFQLVISPTATLQQLKDRLGAQGLVDTSVIEISNRMSAELNGLTFDISPSGPQMQAVLDGRVTTWNWAIMPKQKGNCALHLTVRALALIDEVETPYTILDSTKIVYARTVKIHVSPGSMALRFVGNNWQYLSSAIVIPLAVWWWKSRKSGAQRRRQSS